MNLTDTEEVGLVKKASQGDKSAFDQLMVAYQRRVRKLVGRYFSQESEVSDVTQEVFIRAYRGIGNFRNESAFYTWLYRIAINTAKNYLLYCDRRPPSTDIDYESAEQLTSRTILKELSNPEQMMICNELEDRVFEVLEELPAPLRVALILRDVEGFSYEDIADVMACPVGTVRSRIYRARSFIDDIVRDALTS